MTRNRALAIGVFATLGSAALWHGPGGAAERFAVASEREARTMLDHYEMTAVTARFDRAPLSRRMMLGGPADDFQRREIKRMTESLSGTATADWAPKRARALFPLPLLVETMLLALATFAFGAILAYVAALRRRALAL